MAMIILQHDETETGPRIRKTLTDIHGVNASIVRKGIGGLTADGQHEAEVDLYRYTRPSNGQVAWLIEARIFFPPDVELFRGYVIDQEPTDENIRDIVAMDLQKGSVI